LDIFFQDPTEVPLPPDEVRIREMAIIDQISDDRVKIFIEIDPFQQRPNIDVKILSRRDKLEVSAASIISTMTRKVELTLHLRRPQEPGDLSDLNDLILQATLYYLPILKPDNETVPDDLILNPEIIDQKEISFSTFIANHK
jgi:hypothetical protein